MKIKTALVLLVLSVCLNAAGAFGQTAVREPAPPVELNSLPRFRGFNLTEKFTAGANKPFREEDFRLISGWGFNFVRLPLDYRSFVKGLDVSALDEKTMREIDEAVAFGLKYNIHVCLNFHRAPGYCVNPPAEKTSLWTDGAAQADFARLWGLFAARYRGVSSRSLSFNLVNEPPDMDAAVYAGVMMKAVRSIRAEDPWRLILVDGLAWGQKPVPGLSGGWIIQSTRGYAPMEVTHYRASWIKGSDRWPAPEWPMYKKLCPYLYGPEKSAFQSSLVISLNAERAARISVTVHQVSALSRLLIKADGRTVLDHLFRPGPGAGEWKEVVFEKQWNIYQNIYDKSFEAVIPANTKSITIENTEGDWLTLNEIRLDAFTAAMKEPLVIATGADAWGEKQRPLALSAAGAVVRDQADIRFDRRWLSGKHYSPWIDPAHQGNTVMVGECGVYSRTPYPVAFAFLEDLLATFKAQGWGWALWNFRGDFGVLDSNRADVAYEAYEGHKLDRKMLDLLRKY